MWGFTKVPSWDPSYSISTYFPFAQIIKTNKISYHVYADDTLQHHQVTSFQVIPLAPCIPDFKILLLFHKSLNGLAPKFKIYCCCINLPEHSGLLVPVYSAFPELAPDMEKQHSALLLH
ncbi:hypothetical protein CHARACLAT_030009 [Characodon lateralis]|uniref:Leptin receptor n=1 Tax=Characodon lateralis TaxID=208331 RepID=A0ABU7EYF4_9TELE|nr:hypothetical protein [Characodon lateralis]